jgi:hypothetical protein
MFTMRRRPRERARATEQAKCKAQRYQLVIDGHMSSSKPASSAVTADDRASSCFALSSVQCPDEETEPATALFPGSRTSINPRPSWCRDLIQVRGSVRKDCSRSCDEGRTIPVIAANGYCQSRVRDCVANFLVASELWIRCEMASHAQPSDVAPPESFIAFRASCRRHHRAIKALLCKCPKWLNRVDLTARRSLPVFLDKWTFSESVSISPRCHHRKSVDLSIISSSVLPRQNIVLTDSTDFRDGH